MFKVERHVSNLKDHRHFIERFENHIHVHGVFKDERHVSCLRDHRLYQSADSTSHHSRPWLLPDQQLDWSPETLEPMGPCPQQPTWLVELADKLFYFRDIEINLINSL